MGFILISRLLVVGGGADDAVLTAVVVAVLAVAKAALCALEPAGKTRPLLRG